MMGCLYSHVSPQAGTGPFLAFGKTWLRPSKHPHSQGSSRPHFTPTISIED